MKQLLTIFCVMGAFITHAQDQPKQETKEERQQRYIEEVNPFRELGYKPRISTLSKGKYREAFPDSIVQIGNFTYNILEKRISGVTLFEEVGISEATARPDIVSRWMSPDPLSDEFPDKSPYNFVNNNPIRFVDPLGLAPEDIIIHFTDANGKKQQVNYAYGSTYEGDDQFVKDVFSALNHIVENDADATGVIKTLANSETMDVNIFQNTSENNKHIGNSRLQTYFKSDGANSGNAEIIWDSHKGAEFTNVKGFFSWLTGNGYSEDGKISPAETLLHELGHAESYLSNPKKHNKDSKTILNNAYGNREEFDVITKVENPASAKLKHVQRQGHYGTFYQTTSPTTIKSTKKKK